ncbi:hypothetical protein RB195_008749 [Necator americanus]|uniref:Cytochrome b561 domain-containing protein n=1 Tax=Necator americanus TaxID=51031 RepID=A0ABR1CQ40_NECAM
MALLFDPHFTLLREDQSAKLFNVLLVISQALGGLAILLVAIWMGGYEDGFSWTEDPEREFHYHPTFMVMGMVFLYGESMLVYRVFRNERKKFSKTLHVCLHSMVLVFMIIALKAVWDSHDLHKTEQGELDPLPNMISLHSWIGLSVVIAFSAQYAVGFITFFAPGLSIPIRQLVMPFHQLIGMMIFVAVSITVGMGISERAAWKHTCWTKGRELCGQQAVANLVGMETSPVAGRREPSSTHSHYQS